MTNGQPHFINNLRFHFDTRSFSFRFMLSCDESDTLLSLGRKHRIVSVVETRQEKMGCFSDTPIEGSLGCTVIRIIPCFARVIRYHDYDVLVGFFNVQFLSIPWNSLWGVPHQCHGTGHSLDADQSEVIAANSHIETLNLWGLIGNVRVWLAHRSN